MAVARVAAAAALLALATLARGPQTLRLELASGLGLLSGIREADALVDPGVILGDITVLEMPAIPASTSRLTIVIEAVREREVTLECPDGVPQRVSMAADVPSTVKAMQARVLTVLEKWPPAQQLSDALRQALTLDAERRAKEQRLAQFKTLLLSLTVEEFQVLEGILAGKPNKAIARMLKSSLRTVESRRGAVLKKLQAKSLAALVRLISEYEELSDSPLFPVISFPDSHASHGKE